jgi:hypothetical protein
VLSSKLASPVVLLETVKVMSLLRVSVQMGVAGPAVTVSATSV